MSQVSIKLDPLSHGVVLELDQDHQITISPRDGWEVLVGILKRHNEAEQSSRAHVQAQARLAAQAKSTWPKGLPVRFVPPKPTPWTEAAFWPPGRDYAEGEVIAEHVNGDLVSVEFPLPNGKLGIFAVPARHLRPKSKQITAKGKVVNPHISLADLGL